jgi:hypothetical protein
MAIKVSIGRLRVDLPELERQVPLQGFRWLAVSNAHLLAVAELESDGERRDPFDRLLVCQSRVEPMQLLTALGGPWWGAHRDGLRMQLSSVLAAVCPLATPAAAWLLRALPVTPASR